jgi:hypothetical protein
LRRISRSGVFYKQVFPVLWGALSLVVVIYWARDIALAGSDRSLFELLIPCAVAAFGNVLNGLYTSGVADEVTDAGDYLLVRIGAKATRVRIADIMSVSESQLFHPHRITLRLVRPGPLGGVISFLPPLDVSFLIPLATSRITDDLTKRVERVQGAMRE